MKVMSELNDLIELFSETLTVDLIDMVISGARGTEVKKIKLRPVLIKGCLVFQMTKYVGNKVLHENFEREALLETLAADVFDNFKQVQIRTKTEQASALISKKGQVTIKRKNTAACGVCQPNLEHNRTKTYVLKEGVPVPFLIDLGVMHEDGTIVKKKYDKFKQMNRYLEFVEDILPELDKDRELIIIDFGCGKSYLTFAMYYYLKILKGYDIRIIGLDLKEDVISHCNRLKEKYGFDKLNFLCGDIAHFEGVDKVDMVVTLHACDTATDYALYKAVLWQAKVILSVPCCQHELNGQIHSEALSGMFKYGLIKERFAALATDSMRAMLLESVGYRTQILEFIDMEHTPKNILIRAILKNGITKCRLSEEYKQCRNLIHAEPTLERLLCENKE